MRASTRVLLRWAWTIAILTCSAPAEEPDVGATYDKLKAVAEAQLYAKKPELAVTVCEHFLTQFPEAPGRSRPMVVFINEIVNKYIPSAQARQTIFERAVDDFESCPDYYCYGVAGLARIHNDAKEWPQAEMLLADAFELMADRLPRDYYLGYNLYFLHMYSVAKGGDPAGAFELGKQYAAESPWMLSDRGYLRALWDVCRYQKDAALMAQALKTYCLLCPFDDRCIGELLEIADLTFAQLKDEAAKRMFRQAQEDPDAANPLAEFEPVEFDLDAMLERAGPDPIAKINAYLACGKVAEALPIARDFLITGKGNNQIKSQDCAARCFKAHDLSVSRGIDFLTKPDDQMLADLEIELVVP